VGDAQALATAIHQALTDTNLQKQLLKGATERAFDFTFPAIEAKLNRIMCIEAL
jgi:glycosyltransferase involved in cell wall biosynthesis